MYATHIKSVHTNTLLEKGNANINWIAKIAKYLSRPEYPSDHFIKQNFLRILQLVVVHVEPAQTNSTAEKLAEH